nr:hypothetical protein [uncultured Desulfobacter sp.]
MVLDNKTEAGLFLERGQILRNGDMVSSDDGVHVKIIAAREQVSTARPPPPPPPGNSTLPVTIWVTAMLILKYGRSMSVIPMTTFWTIWSEDLACPSPWSRPLLNLKQGHTVMGTTTITTNGSKSSEDPMKSPWLIRLMHLVSPSLPTGGGCLFPRLGMGG